MTKKRSRKVKRVASNDMLEGAISDIALALRKIGKAAEERALGGQPHGRLGLAIDFLSSAKDECMRSLDDLLCVTLTKKRLKEMLDSAYISGAQDERAAIARKRNYV